MRVALYLRVSTDDRQNLDTQRLPLYDFCRAQGWTDVIEYADEASASNVRERTAWRRLMTDASQRRFDLLLGTPSGCPKEVSACASSVVVAVHGLAGGSG